DVDDDGSAPGESPRVHLDNHCRFLAWAKTVCSARAVVQLQPERTLPICTVELVLLTMRKGWVSVGPRGTLPKSRDTSSNNDSAQLAAAEWLARPSVGHGTHNQNRPMDTTRLYRIMLAGFLMLNRPYRSAELPLRAAIDFDFVSAQTDQEGDTHSYASGEAV